MVLDDNTVVEGQILDFMVGTRLFSWCVVDRSRGLLIFSGDGPANIGILPASLGVFFPF